MIKRYIVHKDDEMVTVSIDAIPEGYRIVLGEETLIVNSRPIGGSKVHSLLINHQSYETATMPSRDGLDVYVSGDVFRVRVTDELWARAAEGAEAAGTGKEEVPSPMPGAVIGILVQPGQAVTAGQTVAVVEAMKMQNEVPAVRGGKVLEVRAKEGDVVEQGTVLVVLGPAAEAGS